MDCVYISEGSHEAIYGSIMMKLYILRGICHEEDSIIFKVLSFNVVFNSMDYYNVFHRLYEFTVV